MSSIEDKDMLMKNKISKMSLLGNWHTEDIDSERIKILCFFNWFLVKKMHIHNSSYIVYFSVERSGKSYIQGIRAKL